MKRKCIITATGAIFAAAIFTGCTQPVNELHYVKLGQVICTFDSAGSQTAEIVVETSPAAWKFSGGEAWVKTEPGSEGKSLVISVEANSTGQGRETTVSVTAGEAAEHIKIIQLAGESSFARYRRVVNFSDGGVMSPSGRYVGGFVTSLAEDGSYLFTPTIIETESGEAHEFGPFPQSLQILHEPMCITDQGLLFINDGTNGGQLAIDITGDMFRPEAPEGFRFLPEIQGSSADGRHWVGFAKKAQNDMYYPLLWTEGEATQLPLPDKNFRGIEFRNGVMARGISANGEVIYGTSWDNTDFGMLYWKGGKVDWVSKDMHEIKPVEMVRSDGTTYEYNLADGMVCDARRTNVSPSGKWIAGSYRTETLSENKRAVERSQWAAFYNTETETTVVVKDYGESTGVHVTDDGMAFIALGKIAASQGKVYDLNTQKGLGDTEEWVLNNFGIIIPEGYINYISPDGRMALGTSMLLGVGQLAFINWYIAPPIEE